MVISTRRRAYLYPVKRRAVTVMGVLSTPVHPLNCIASRTMHRVPVIQTVKQTVQLFRKRYTEDITVVQQSTRVADSSMCIKHIINPVYHQEEADRQSKRLATEAEQDNPMHEACF
jgi:hypothetical protein